MKTTNLLKIPTAALVVATLFAGNADCMSATTIHTAGGSEMDVSISKSMSFEEGVQKAIRVYDETQKLFQLQEIAEYTSTKLAQVLEKNHRYDLIMRLKLKEKEAMKGLIEYYMSPESTNFPGIETTNIPEILQDSSVEEIDKYIQYLQNINVSSESQWKEKEVMDCLLLYKMGKQIAQNQQERGQRFQENRFKIMNAKSPKPSYPSAGRR